MKAGRLRASLVATACALFGVGAAASDAARGDPQASAPPAIAPIVDVTQPEARVSIESLAGYLGAVHLHVEPDPALAAAYIAFFAALDAARADAGDLARVPARTFEQFAADARRVAAEVARANVSTGGAYVLGDALATALRALDRTPVAVAGTKVAASRAEHLLATVDRVVAPRVVVNGRYEFAGSIGGPADLGFAADVWLQCRRTPACVDAHDAVFASAMSGVSLVTSLPERIARDVRLAGAQTIAPLLRQAASLEADIAELTSPEALRARLEHVTLGYFRTIAAELEPGRRTLEDAARIADTVDSLASLGRAGAYLAGEEALATSFGILRAPLVDVGRRLSQGVVMGLASSVAGAGLLFAGAQALALFEPGAGPGAAPPELVAIVTRLEDDTRRALATARTDAAVTSNLLDTRLAGLTVALDVVRDDVGRIESAQRRKVAADFAAADARRWTRFDGDNDRCFGLRARDPRTSRLRSGDFRRCEDRFLQGAVRSAVYANRDTEYLLDPRFIEPADARFPFHHHYPQLLTLGGLDASAALHLVDPFEWQQHAAALLRLYQEHPADRSGQAPRREALGALKAAGVRTRQALEALAFDEAGATLRTDTHTRAVEAYFDALDRLADRVRALDDPDADRYGKRLTAGLDQPVPGATKRRAIEATLGARLRDVGGLRTCTSARDENFLPEESRLTAEARRFFDSPITPDELARAWNRTTVDGMGLMPADIVRLVPPPFLWAALDGLGDIEVCLDRLRPVSVAFTREAGPSRDTLLGSATLNAAVNVQFTPSAAAAQAMGRGGVQTPITVATFAAGRSCTFGYRNDEKGCSRADCLRRVAPAFWSDAASQALGGGRCDVESLATKLVQTYAAPSQDALASGLAIPYWTGRAARVVRLESDVLRSSEYQNAAALYLRFYALAAVTLGVHLDSDTALGGFFAADSSSSPRALVNALLVDKAPADAIGTRLGAAKSALVAEIETRARDAQAASLVERLPHYAGISATLRRIDLALAAYAE